MMDDVAGGQAAPTDFTFTWVNHVMKSRDNKMYVPFILTFERASHCLRTPPTTFGSSTGRRPPSR